MAKITFRRMEGLQFIGSSGDGHLGCLCALVNNATVDAGGRVFCEDLYFRFFWVCSLGAELLGHVTTPRLTF